MTTEAQHSETAPEDRVPVGEKVVYGLGTAVDMWGNWLYPGLASTVYNIHLGLDPRVLANVLFFQRVLDAFSDPLLGWLSDNTRSRWGRRRPWILVGGVASGLMLPVLFLASPHWSPSTLAVFVAVTALIYMAIPVSGFNMPYQSLGMELTPDYHERTRVMAFKQIIQKFMEVAFFVAVPFTTLAWFRLPDAIDPTTGVSVPRYDVLTGAFWYCVIIGGLMVLVSVLCFALLKERYYEKLVKKQSESVSLLSAFRDTLWCGPFRTLLFLNLATAIGGGMVGTLGWYTTVYHVCGGDLKSGGGWNMLMGFTYSGASVVGVPIVASLARRFGKRHAALWTLAFALLASLATWVFYSRDFPWLQLFASGTIAIGAAGMNVLNGSMLADVIDYSELSTGKRSEGSFSAIFSWFIKLGLALAAGGSLYVLAYTGFDAKAVVQSESALFNMRLLLALLPAVGLALAMVLIAGYPLSPSKMIEVRTELERRRGVV